MLSFSKVATGKLHPDDKAMVHQDFDDNEEIPGHGIITVVSCIEFICSHLSAK